MNFIIVQATETSMVTQLKFQVIVRILRTNIRSNCFLIPPVEVETLVA